MFVPRWFTRYFRVPLLTPYLRFDWSGRTGGGRKRHDRGADNLSGDGRLLSFLRIDRVHYEQAPHGFGGLDLLVDCVARCIGLCGNPKPLSSSAITNTGHASAHPGWLLIGRPHRQRGQSEQTDDCSGRRSSSRSNTGPGPTTANCAIRPTRESSSLRTTRRFTAWTNSCRTAGSQRMS